MILDKSPPPYIEINFDPIFPNFSIICMICVAQGTAFEHLLGFFLWVLALLIYIWEIE